MSAVDWKFVAKALIAEVLSKKGIVASDPRIIIVLSIFESLYEKVKGSSNSETSDQRLAKALRRTMRMLDTLDEHKPDDLLAARLLTAMALAKEDNVTMTDGTVDKIATQLAMDLD